MALIYHLYKILIYGRSKRNVLASHPKFNKASREAAESVDKFVQTPFNMTGIV